MAVTAIVAVRPARGAPGDIFTIAAPAASDGAPRGADIAAGDVSVSTKTGALTFAFPIKVPPGRGGVQPQLALSYSSHAPTYGSLAAGWSLAGVPIITEDTSRGRLWATIYPTAGLKNYTSSMAGGRPLILVDEPGSVDLQQYRAQNDTSFTRYEKMPATAPWWWQAYGSDGTTYYFGHQDGHTDGCSTISDGYAPLTRTEDPYGNRVDYIYGPGVEGECRLEAITWGHNENAGIGYFAAIELDYADVSPSCADMPVGQQMSYRTGTKIVTGASQLDAIRIAAFPPIAASSVTKAPIPGDRDHTRTITLGYSATTAACDQLAAAHRTLTSIQESAVGRDAPQVTLPPTTFTYGAAGPQHTPPEKTYLPWGDSTAYPQNLGWGYRFGNQEWPPTQWPTVEAMMVDIDGDGLVDRLSSEPVLENGHIKFCQARWRRNLGSQWPGHYEFAAARDIQIPTMKWATPASSPDRYEGGAHADVADPPLGAPSERCALNYQLTRYLNSHNGGGGFACQPGLTACPASGYCSNGTDCTYKYGEQENTIFAWRWFDIDRDGLVDLIGSPSQGGIGSYDLQWGNGVFGEPTQPEPAIFGAFPPCPSTSYPGTPPSNADAYTMCGGMYPWLVYKNKGNGVFGRPRPFVLSHPHAQWGPLPDDILYQPMPLETTTGDSSIVSRPVGQDTGTIDLDGDGRDDGVFADSWPWRVYRGGASGLGQMYPASGTTPFYFFGSWGKLFRSELGAGLAEPEGVEGLADFNGDGLVDRWVNCAGCTSSSLELNDGVQFRTLPPLYTIPVGTRAASTVLTYTTFVDEPHGSPKVFVCQGDRVDTRRLLDVDADGRPDVVARELGEMQIDRNQGAAFAGARWDGDIGEGLLRRTIVDGQCENPYGTELGRWELRSDMIDLDGDGLAESVDFGGSLTPASGMLVTRPQDAFLTPRLLTTITNHRGATTTIDYSSMNGPAVEQHPEEGKSSPSTLWVVQGLTTRDEISNTTTKTSYRYVRPRTTRDPDLGSVGFRGFEEVRTTSPTGATTIEHFRFEPDWSGQLIKRLVVPAPSEQIVADEARSLEEIEIEQRTLFDEIDTFHATVIDHWTCTNGQTEGACRANTDGHTRTRTTLTGLASTTGADRDTPLMWVTTASRLQSGAAAADGDRETTTTFALHSDNSTYRLRPLVETHAVQQSGAMAVYRKTAKTWDATFRDLITAESWVDGNDAARAITRFAHDPRTGNRFAVWKPEQWAANPDVNNNPLQTRLEYDDRQLFVTVETNELGHVRRYTYDYGTGARLQTRGPNVPACATTQTCPAGWPVEEEHTIRVDGLGRTLERFETFWSDGSVFQRVMVESNVHVDAAPASVTHESAIEHLEGNGTTRYARAKTELDGHGRPVRKTAYVLGSAAADHVTTFVYGDDGMLAEVRVPDPTADDASTVSYTYRYDSLGRVRAVRRPDAAAEIGRSGVDVSYDGLAQTTSDVVGAGGGVPAARTTRKDAFGRVVQVDELIAASPATWATTRYGYDAADNVVEIVDPDGAITTLAHDLAGRRTAITRGTRTWRYGYDRNGNAIAEISPCTGVLCEAAHTMTVAYDALDRPTSKLIAPRELADADLALFGSSREAFTYDADAGGIGRLTRWESFAPGATTFTSAREPELNGQGQLGFVRQRTNAAGYQNLERTFLRRYDVSGAIRETFYYDIVGGQVCANGSYSTTLYDARGLPSAVQVQTCIYEVGPASYLVNTRNVAGLVTKRSSLPYMGPVTHSEATWAYDSLGRVIRQDVARGASLERVVRQDLAYFGNDDPKSLDHWIGNTAKRLDFTYDARHQLLTATSAGSALFTGTYEYGAAGRLTHANVGTVATPPLGNDVEPRDVLYEYQGSDPEQVTALIRTSNGEPYTSYAYDEAGNQTLGCSGAIVGSTCQGESLRFVYDGKNQLRRVTKRSASGAVLASEEYWYDDTGARTQVVKRDGAGAKTGMIWFIEDTEAHYDAQGTVIRAHGHVRLGAPVMRTDRQSDGPATVEYQFHGLADNTIAAVDLVSGTINARFSYAPFGEVLETTSDGGPTTGTDAHRRRMNDKFVDEISDLAYYGFRYYDKVAMTWTQVDPAYRFAPDVAKAGSPRRANLYQFSLANPLRYVDPDGRDAKPSLSTYRSELEVRNAYRAHLEVDANWQMVFVQRSGYVGGDSGYLKKLLGDPDDPCNGATSLCETPHGSPELDEIIWDAAVDHATGWVLGKAVGKATKWLGAADEIAEGAEMAAEGSVGFFDWLTFGLFLDDTPAAEKTNYSRSGVWLSDHERQYLALQELGITQCLLACKQATQSSWFERGNLARSWGEQANLTRLQEYNTEYPSFLPPPASYLTNLPRSHAENAALPE